MPESISVEEYRALLAAGGASKYGAKPVRDPVDGYFASTGEYGRWGELRLLRDQGAIADLRRQVRYPLLVNGITVATYIGDFQYVEDGATIVEDFKGGTATRTAVYKLKARLMIACLGISIRETGKGGR